MLGIDGAAVYSSLDNGRREAAIAACLHEPGSQRTRASLVPGTAAVEHQRQAPRQRGGLLFPPKYYRIFPALTITDGTSLRPQIVPCTRV